MNIKRIGIFLIIALFLFGCKTDPDPPPPPVVKQKEKAKVQVTVTFNVDGGSPNISSVVIDQGSSLGSNYPANPKKTGLAFAGWYEANDNTYSKKYTSSTIINNNILLKARWLAQKTTDCNFSNFVTPTVSNGAGTVKNENISYQGKSNVTKLSPNDSSAGYLWNVVSYSLASYVGKEITITMSMNVWVNTPAKIVWQVNNSGYDIIVGDDKNPITANSWVTVNAPGSLTFTPGSGNVVYLSGGGNGGQLKDNAIDIYIENFVMTISDSTEPVVPDTIFLTVGSKINLTSRLNAEMSGKIITWSSANTSNVSVDAGGNVTSGKISFTSDEGGNKQYKSGAAQAPAVITAQAADGATQIFIVAATTEAQEDIMTLPPFKDYFPSSILVGNIAATNDVGGGVINNAKLTRHFNALTAENVMKPDAISNGRNASTGVISYTWTNADNFVNAATASNFKIIGHTLLWHSQIPQWQKDMATAGRETALAAMKQFITDVMTRYKGKIYSWDVLNEAFPDGGVTSDWKTSMRTGAQGNPWYIAIGSDFVYEAFLAARLADPNAILYYNDYNTDNTARATLIRDMARDVNQKYATSGDKPAGEPVDRLLIEGIGMQEHHNLGVSANNVKNALTMFRALGVKVSVSEIDVLGYNSYNDFSSATGQGSGKHTSSTVTNNQLLTQAARYQEYMAVYMEFKDIIERVSIWGVTDNNSWRSGGLPLLFDPNGRAKPAYYKFAGAVTK